MFVKAVTDTCPTTYGSSAEWEAYKGANYQVSGTVGSACGTNFSASNAYDFQFGCANYGSGPVTQGTQDFGVGTLYSHNYAFGTGGVTVSETGWSGYCNTVGSSSPCEATTSTHDP